MKRFFPLLVIGHALLLMLFAFLWLNLPYTYDYEFSLLSRIAVVKNIILGSETKPDRDDFLFVNVAYEKKLVPKLDDFGFPIGNEAITDRSRLAEFFQRSSATNEHKVIVCDVFADVPTEDDSLLETSVRAAKNVLFPYHFVSDSLTKPVVDVPTALGDYSSDFGTFVKYSFVQHDTARTIATAMYQKADKGKFKYHALISSLDGKPALNSFIIDLPVRQYDIFTNDSTGYTSMHLQDVLSLPDSMFNALLKERIVIVGDFLENDMHTTMYGETAGPLIHANAYLALRSGANRLTVFFFLYLFSCMLFFSYRLLRQDRFTLNWLEKLKNSKYGGFIFEYLEYALFLAVVSSVSYVLFGIHLNILVMSLYFSIADKVVEYYRSKAQ